MSGNQVSFDILQQIQQGKKVLGQDDIDQGFPDIFREIQHQIFSFYPSLVDTTDLKPALNQMELHFASDLIRVELYYSRQVQDHLLIPEKWKGVNLDLVGCRRMGSKPVVVKLLSDYMVDLAVVVISRGEIVGAKWPSEVEDLFELHQAGLVLLLDNQGQERLPMPPKWVMLRTSLLGIEGRTSQYLGRLDFYLTCPQKMKFLKQCKEDMLRILCRALLESLCDQLREERKALTLKLRWMNFQKSNRYVQKNLLDSREISQQVKEELDNYQAAFKGRLEGFITDEGRLWQELDFHIDQFTADCFLIQNARSRREYQLRPTYQEVINAILHRHSLRFEEFEESEIIDLSDAVGLILSGYLESYNVESDSWRHIIEINDYRREKLHCSLQIDPDFLAYIDVKPTIKDYSKAIWSAVRSPMTLLFGVYMYATLFFGFDISQRDQLFGSVPDWVVIWVLISLAIYGFINTWLQARQKKTQKEKELLEKAKKEYKNKVRRSCSDFKKYWDNSINYKYLKRVKREFEFEIESIKVSLKNLEEDSSTQRRRFESLAEGASGRYKSLVKLLQVIESELIVKLMR